jgi:succinate dehydrogenase/fumarate reductase flavoprotein subunit
VPDRRRRLARAHARSLNESVDGIQTFDTDILILGARGAGLFATLHAKKARPELNVTIAVKGLLGKCGSARMVQGGCNVALAPEVQSSATSWTRSRAAG